MVEKFTSYREDIVTEIGNNGYSTFLLIKKIIIKCYIIICIAKRNFIEVLFVWSPFKLKHRPKQTNKS